MEEKTKAQCLLRIENPTTGFSRNLNIEIDADLIEDRSHTFRDIYNGASQTLLQKYTPQMKEADTRIYLLVPEEIDHDSWNEFLDDADTNKATEDIQAILNNLPKDKRDRVLQQLAM